ncbi:MAPEG family protein [Gemmobacter serpentinus]|uniref:MAPEG family protein n=1 Tax=Gemmobacter serpentinus TaxID=2652247 RepID=UPI001CF68561|nr:MAPEG family protein [Gemmobacter serpentinus]
MMTATFSAELIALLFAVLVQMLSIAAAGAQMNRELGPRYNAGPRDAQPEMSPRLGRLRRAVNNGFEGLAMFTPVVLVTVLSGQSSAVTAFAAWIYVAARLLYIPAYALGLAPWRSLIWGIGFLAILTMIGACLF